MTLCGLACQKARPAQVAEVELLVEVQSEVEAPRTFIFISPEPCDAPDAARKKFGGMDARKVGRTFVEIFVPQGTIGYACAAAFDAQGRLVGLGGAADNPLHMEGKGEVTFKPTIQVKRLPEPRAAPAGF